MFKFLRNYFIAAALCAVCLVPVSSFAGVKKEYKATSVSDSSGLCTITFSAVPGDAEDKYVATTIANPQIPIDDLELLLKPLTKDELIVEANAWQDLLKKKAIQINGMEVQKRQKARAINLKKDEIKDNIEIIKKIEKVEKEKVKKGDEELLDVAKTGGEKVDEIAKAEAVAKVQAALKESAENLQDAGTEIHEIAMEAEAVSLAQGDDEESADSDKDLTPAEKVLKEKSEEEATTAQQDLKEKTEEVAAASQELKNTVDAIAKSNLDLSEKVEKMGQAEIELQSKVKEQYLVGINKLREEQTILIDRFTAVIAALKFKGGEAEAEGYEKYLDAVSGFTLSTEDIQDVNALKIIAMGWLKSAEGGVRWLKNIISFILTVILFYILSCIVGRVVGKAVSKSKKFSDLLKHFFENVARKTVIVIGAVIALSMLEIDIAPFLAGLGVAGFVLGFALQGTLSNFASGLMILIYRPFDVGQVISTAGVTGVVDSMTLVATTIKTFDNQVVIVPNGEIWGGVITNVTGSKTRRIDMTFGIGYSDDIGTAVQVLEKILSSHKLVLNNPAPTVKLNELADSSVNFICRPWVKTEDYWTVYWDVTRTVKERFDAENISIPFPQQDVHLHQGE